MDAISRLSAGSAFSMGKKSRAKRDRRDGRGTSSLAEHTRIGKSLLPPMLRLPMAAHYQSWPNERLPEMLWACLVVTVLPRETSLEVFREIASVGAKYRDRDEARGWGLTHSQLACQPVDLIRHLVAVVSRRPLGYAALRPLLLLDSLPARDIWSNELTATPDDSDWQSLSIAVAKTLDHQSQEATDVRWLRLLFSIASGSLIFSEGMKERAMEIIEYPNRGEMRGVRPSIRAAELSLNMGGPRDSRWADAMWRECLEKTGCILGSPRSGAPLYDLSAQVKQWATVQDALMRHWRSTLETTAVDAQHDATFAFAFYALAILEDLAVAQNRLGIAGRVLLRSLVECRITLAYLRVRNDAELWKRFRAFGSGQAKLALLKVEELAGDGPTFVRRETLEALSNEDYYEEFVRIDLGHWCGVDLRKMAEASDTKTDYDAFYGWSSTFAHGQWPALRDTCMTHCLNPLHRGHRVPLPQRRTLDDAIPDAVVIANRILEEVSALNPTFDDRLVPVPP